MNGPENLIDIPVNSAPLPQVENHTAFPSQYYQMLDVSDQVFHVIVCRQTFNLRKIDSEGCLVLADEQTPLVTGDQFYRDINNSSIIQESDFSPYKPKCDILFAYAYAHAPGGKACPRWPVAVQIGAWQKQFTVTGPRKIQLDDSGLWHLTEPEAITQMPICYEKAYGGTCQWPLDNPDPEQIYAEQRNPIGCGYLNPEWLEKAQLNSFPASQIEAFDQAFVANDFDYPVVGLGAIGRWWLPRRSKAGTYDDIWKKTRWPHLPFDFDFSYWNSAPEDQQIDYPKGGETVTLINLHPNSRVQFRLPHFNVKLLLHLDAGIPLFKPMSVDTLVFDLKNLQLIVVQRALIAASAGVDSLEIGTWDIAAARAANDQILAQQRQQSPEQQTGASDGR
ncbi:MAG: DUF2169 domain-containing protein [Methylococcales bacterium]